MSGERVVKRRGGTGPSMKTCTGCREDKPLDEFNARKGSRDGLQFRCKECRSAYRQANRDRIAERQRVYQQANRDRIAEYQRAHQQANSEQIAERKRAHYQANRKQIAERHRAYRQANREHIAERERAYRQANRNAVSHRRRARLRFAVPQRWRVHDIIPFACYWCGANLRAYGAISHVDHVMPIALGGPADSSNEVSSCSSCNLSKSDKHPLVWIAELSTRRQEDDS
jgi:hypothetical protein